MLCARGSPKCRYFYCFVTSLKKHIGFYSVLLNRMRKTIETSVNSSLACYNESSQKIQKHKKNTAFLRDVFFSQKSATFGAFSAKIPNILKAGGEEWH